MNPNIEAAAAALVAAKQAEAVATAARLAAEDALIALLPAKPEGTVSEAAGGFKVAVTFGMRRSVDEAALGAVRGQLPPALFARLFRFKPEVSVRDLRYVECNEPELYAIAAQAITTKPSKPSVKVERIEPVAKAA
jgi:hypothetical protein